MIVNRFLPAVTLTAAPRGVLSALAATLNVIVLFSSSSVYDNQLWASAGTSIE